MCFLMNDFLTSLAVILTCSLDTNKEYILDRNPTNSKGAVPLHSSLNFPKTLAFWGLQSLKYTVCAVFWVGTGVQVVRESLHVYVHVAGLYMIAKTVSVGEQ